MGRPGDLILIVFADALTRSWKQIIKFQSGGEAPGGRGTPPSRARRRRTARRPYVPMEGVVRDERGLVFEREESD